MAVAAPPAVAEDTLERLERIWAPRPGVLGWLSTTDHKRIGLLYFWTTLAFFAAGGVEALLMRTQLDRPNNGFLSPNTYDQLFSVHGITMIFFFINRRVGTHFFDVAQGGSALLWQHLFWIFGHPEVYILIVPAFGIATAIIPTFTQRRIVAFPLVAMAELLVVFIGFGVWAHHMFSTGLPTIALVFFAAASAMVVIPSTIQVFAWCMSFVTGSPQFKTPLLFIAGFIFMFVTGGLTGIMFVAIPFDQQVTDTYFIVAHFHYIIFGAAVFPIFGGMYYLFPKVTGRMYFELPGQISFWTIFVGTNLLFFPMHILGLHGMTRREYTCPSGLGWGSYNLAETIGGFITSAGILLLLA